MAKQKEGWLYKYSESLQKNIALHKATGWVYCEDGIKYSPSEIAEIKKTGKNLSKEIHLLKKHFKGEIIKTEPSKKKAKRKKGEEDKYAGLPDIW